MLQMGIRGSLQTGRRAKHEVVDPVRKLGETGNLGPRGFDPDEELRFRGVGSMRPLFAHAIDRPRLGELVPGSVGDDHPDVGEPATGRLGRQVRELRGIGRVTKVLVQLTAEVAEGNEGRDLSLEGRIELPGVLSDLRRDPG